MRTKTCMQFGKRREHEVPESDSDGTRDGYSQCIHCGATVYVGQGHCSPQSLQAQEGRAAQADRRR